jgi:hypothetical protein
MTVPRILLRALLKACDVYLDVMATAVELVLS